MVMETSPTSFAANPDNSPERWYRPGASARKRYRPSAAVVEVLVTPVSTLRRVTVTPGSTPPCWSLTTPSIDAPAPWPKTGDANMTLKMTGRSARAGAGTRRIRAADRPEVPSLKPKDTIGRLLEDCERAG